jgi:hypothetical protein
MQAFKGSDATLDLDWVSSNFGVLTCSPRKGQHAKEVSSSSHRTVYLRSICLKITSSDSPCCDARPTSKAVNHVDAKPIRSTFEYV